MSTVTDSESNEYQTVRIGNQIWMRENLKATLYSDLTTITGCLDKGEQTNSVNTTHFQLPMGLHLTLIRDMYRVLAPPDGMFLTMPIGRNSLHT